MIFKAWVLIMIAVGGGESNPRTVTVVDDIATRDDCYRLGQRYVQTARSMDWSVDQKFTCTEIRKVR